jgi:cation:H+ antiporter
MPSWYTEPSLTLAICFVLAGFYCLIKGADFLVEGAVDIARKFNMTPAVIGATVVAFGTSLPELVVSVGANVKALEQGLGHDPNGPAAIAIGNIVGSNIFNVGAILGLSALFTSLTVAKSILKRDYPLMIIALILMIVLSVWGENQCIDRFEGILLVIGLLLFTFQAIKTGRVDPGEELTASPDENLGLAIAMVFLGTVMLALGGEVSLTGAISISKSLGMSERVIGLTVMAIGTSLPELATSIQAVKKGEHDIAVANVVGSNIFNVLSIVGISSIIIPLPVHPDTISWDYPWMLGMSLALLPMFYIFKKVNRWMGCVLLSCLMLYIVLLLLRPV